MEVMTLDEAIKHAKEVAIQRENDALAWEKAKPSYHADEALCEENAGSCRKCAAEYRQLVVWLKDYKRLLERESCKDAISRQDVLDLCDSKDPDYKVIHLKEDVECLPSVIPKSDWIPVGERLPKEGGKYICWFKEQKRDIVTMVAWQPKLRSWNLTGNMAYWKVFAWMPLPTPFKPQESEDKGCR